MPHNAIYTDLSGYYDLMCADIDYQAQSQCVQRIQRLFGNGGKRHLDLACGTGPHVRHFLDAGFQSGGLDIHQPMLDLAKARCPEAMFSRQDMCDFSVEQPMDLITCFLYSVHYSASIERLGACIARVHAALADGGVFCFNAVDKARINNSSFVSHTAHQGGAVFRFSSGWYYPGDGEQQRLRLRIERTDTGGTQLWKDEHPMVAVTFQELIGLLDPYFEVQLLEHDYQRLLSWDGTSGNALLVCTRRTLA